ncbi:hypothetical protein FRB99_000030 [Tulasnella sp. 403]|nr:hypothetical protein FRB99_000030 [Tulasnella sp. 403]
MAPQKKTEKPFHALVAGATAGAVEGFVTYPTEFVKTASQFSGNKLGPIGIIKTTLRDKGVRGLYAGCGALVSGNALKAGGKVSPPRGLLAGLAAGITEAIFAVTPSETIKTKLIDDSKKPEPRFRGLVHGTTTIIREEGFRGIYRGLFPVMLRQGANSAVRFTSYSTLKQFVQGNARPGQTLSTGLTFAIGGIAGLITVYCTMPFECVLNFWDHGNRLTQPNPTQPSVVKTRMQSLQARQLYRNSFHCAYKIFTEDGILGFWKGTTPRLARLVMAGGIVFTVYEKTIVLIGGRSL